MPPQPHEDRIPYRQLTESIVSINETLAELVTSVAILDQRVTDTRTTIGSFTQGIDIVKSLLNEIDKKVVLVTTLNTAVTEQVKAIKEQMKADYVTKAEYEPVRKIVLGLAGVVLMAVSGALVKLVVH